MNWLDSGYKPYQKEKAEKRPRFPYIRSGLLRCWPSVFRHELNGSNPLVCLKAIRVLLYDCVILWGKWAIRSSLQVPLRDVQPTWGGKTMDHRHRIKIEKSCIHGWLWVKTMMRTPSWHWSRVTAQASAEEFMYGDRSHRYFRIYGYESHIIYFWHCESTGRRLSQLLQLHQADEGVLIEASISDTMGKLISLVSYDSLLLSTEWRRIR